MPKIGKALSGETLSSQIGESLLSSGLISEEQLQKAIEKQSVSNEFIGMCLVSLGYISEEELTKTLSQLYGVPLIELADLSIDPYTVELIPQSLAIKHGLIPLVKTDTSLQIAMFDPSNLMAVNEIKFVTGLDVEVVVTSHKSLKDKQEALFEKNSLDQIMNDLGGEDLEVVHSEDNVNVDELAKATEDAPVVKLVNAILSDAIKKRASDIHIEPYEKTFRVRFRIDGVLYEIMRPPMKLRNALISRLKIMASLDISERRLPQDGRIKLKLPNGGEMDFRVNSLPTLFGEKVVLRLLDKSNLQLDMEKLGFIPKQLEDFIGQISKPHGMILVTGPTGSGKTTTLYSALSELNKSVTNISTAEDPVEYNLAGINQAQMHDEIGFNFASALRAFLRQDPDVIMVGEIRDYETAEIAIKASLTGHLVLSTLHTNDAAATISRLLNMGVEPFLVASSVNLIVAQRLARRVCQSCAQDIQVDPEILMGLGMTPEQIKVAKLRQGQGCDRCSGTGYKGRVALYEVMVLTEVLREMILSGASTSEIKKQAISDGMYTLRGSGLYRLVEGVTTVEEVFRVTMSD